MTRIAYCLAAAAALTPWTSAAAAAQMAPTINEWTVPWTGTRPRDPYLDRQGRVWFVGQTGHYVG
ncbi:MAG: lyase, partial [Gemmatimonadales bacterium]